MSRQMFRNGGAAFPDLSGDGKVTQKDILMGRGVIPMEDGGVVEQFSAVFASGDTDAFMDFFVENEAQLRREARQNPSLANMIKLIDTMEAQEANREIDRTQAMAQMPSPRPLMEVPAPGGSSYIPDPRPFGGEQLQPGVRYEDLGTLFPQGAESAPQPDLNNYTGIQDFAVGGVAAPAPMAAAPGSDVPPNLASEQELQAMPLEGVAQEASRLGIDPSTVEQMLGEVSNKLGNLENAENYEEVINGIREMDAPIEVRYKELAGLVGEEDAMQTPESVLTLVQPVIMMAGVDQGIGALASEEMTAPVTGDMAEGIMSTVNMGTEEVPPVNFNKGGAVQYFDPANENRVAGAMPGGRLGELYEQRMPIYKGAAGIGDQQAAYDEQKDLTQAQMLFDIAQGALGFAAGAGMPGRSPAEQLAASFTPVLGNIGKRAGELTKFKQEQGKEARALNLAALQSAEKTLAEEQKIKAEKEAREDQQRHEIFRDEISFQFKKGENESAFDYQIRLQNNQAKLTSEENAKDRAFRAAEAVLERAAREGLQLNEFDFKKLMQDQVQKFQKDEAALGREFTGDQAALERNIKIAALDFEKYYKRRGLDLQEIRQKFQEDYQKDSLELERQKAKATEAYQNATIALKKAEVEYNKNLKNDEFVAKAVKNPDDYLHLELSKPTVFKASRSYEKQYQKDMEGTPGEAGQVTQKFQAPWFEPWAQGLIPPSNEKARRVATMIENFGMPKDKYSPTGERISEPEVRLNPEFTAAVIRRANLPGSDISERAKNKFELMMITSDPDALKLKMNEMKNSQMSMLDGLSQATKTDREVIAGKVAEDIEAAFGLGGAFSRAADAGAKAVSVGRISETGAAERGAFILKRVYVDGLTSALRTLGGKENQRLQELLGSVIPGENTIFKDAESYYNESAVYLADLNKAINVLEQDALRSGNTEQTRKTLLALTDLYATKNGVEDLMAALKARNPEISASY